MREYNTWEFLLMLVTLYAVYLAYGAIAVHLLGETPGEAEIDATRVAIFGGIAMVYARRDL